MEVANYHFNEFDSLTFSKGFINYINSDMQGTVFTFIENDIKVNVIIKKNMGFKIGYFVNIPSLNSQKLNEQQEIRFINSLIYYCKKSKVVDFIFPPIHIGNFFSIPPKSIGYKLGIIKLELQNKSIESVFNAFKPVYRRHIRGAEKMGVQIKFGVEFLKEFYGVYSEKLKQENAIFDSFSKIEKLVNDAHPDFEVQCGIAVLDGKIEAGILNVSDKNSAYYLFGGSNKDSHNGSFRLLHWELIKLYHSKGLLTYQFGGFRYDNMLTLKHSNLAAFKMGFGAENNEGFHFTLIINVFKFKIYNILLKIKSKIKL